MDEKLNFFYQKYRGEIKITIISIVITTIISIIIAALFQTADPKIITIAAFGGLTLSLLMGILLNLKRFLVAILGHTRISMVEIDEMYHKSLYKQRLNHFTEEKRLLADVLVRRVLPKLLNQIRKENPSLAKLNIILDSGTTITPVFRYLMGYGLPKNSNGIGGIKTTIYTNNLAGIREVYNVDPDSAQLSERDFNLIGGQPLSTYRACTGPSTIEFLKLLWTDQEKSKEKNVSIGILTANWFIGGADLRNLSLCAKGEGHFEYKESILDNCRYVVFVSPLGKILRFESVEKLNALLKKHGQGGYQSRVIFQKDSNKKIFLLTSFRPDSSLSPLVNLSIQLNSACQLPELTNYISCEDCPIFDPPGVKFDVVTTEVPHHYIRANFSSAYGYKASLS